VLEQLEPGIKALLIQTAQGAHHPLTLKRIWALVGKCFKVLLDTLTLQVFQGRFLVAFINFMLTHN
jgi:hypothetical protein